MSRLMPDVAVAEYWMTYQNKKSWNWIVVGLEHFLRAAAAHVVIGASILTILRDRSKAMEPIDVKPGQGL